MTNQEKIKFLSRYKTIDRRIQAKCDEKSMWMARATKITPTLSDMPKGGQQENKVETSVEKIMEIEKEIDTEIDELCLVKQQIKASIYTVSDEKQQEVLERKYINGQTWEQIAVDMNYTCRNIWYMHGKALNEVKIS